MVSQSGGSFRAYAATAPLWVVTLPLLANNTKGQFA
jgi:hypothetical protein